MDLITRKTKALKGYVESYSISILSEKDPRVQFDLAKDFIKELFKTKM